MKKQYLPVVVVIILWLVIFITNFRPSTWLTGWDNLHPEFNFWLNIKRSLFGVWQEYQGVGLLGGMGHIAALPQQIQLWLMSFVIPAHQIRYVWTMLMLLAGPVGAYVFIKEILLVRNKDLTWKVLVPALTGALYYVFNLNTVQVFIAPYEAFVGHFAVLPWLLWGAVRAFHTPSRRNFLVYGLINVLGMIYAYVPTLFLVYVIVLAIVITGLLLKDWTKKAIISVLLIGIITFCTNAPWLLPFAYFTLTNSQTVINSKINQMATDEIFLRNRKYGTIADTLTLRNFWFETFDYNPKNGQSEPMLNGWTDYTKQPLVQVALIGLSIGIIAGAVIGFTRKETRFLTIAGVVSFVMIANATPPFSVIMDWLREHIPLLSQFFRFPFTKWSVALAFFYSLWISVLINQILHVRRKTMRYIAYGLTASGLLLPLVAMWPMMSGKLISDKVRHEIPREYLDLFSFMNSKPDGRVAILPQPTFWDWKYYRWGSLGSGFIWYGIKQPILDRAFDSWNGANEQYYWELSRTLYAKNPEALQSVLIKYDIRYVLVDENMATSGHPLSLFYPEIYALLAQIPKYQVTKTFGKLSLYEAVNPTSNTFVTLSANLPIVIPSYSFNDNDAAYRNLGNYISNSQPITDNRQPATNYNYPFSSLFTKRSVNERMFGLTESADSIKLITALPINSPGLSIQPQTLLASDSATIYTDGSTVSTMINKSKSLAFDSVGAPTFRADAAKVCNLQKNGEIMSSEIGHFGGTTVRLTSIDQRACLSVWAGMIPQGDGYVVLVTHKHISGRPLLFALINETAHHTELETYLSADSDQTKTDYFILPPLAFDGVGYTAYFANDAIGQDVTINEIQRIRLYKIPYSEMVNLKFTIGNLSQTDVVSNTLQNPIVSHPNPAYYKVSIASKHQSMNASPDALTSDAVTLILSQSFHPGWKAYYINSCGLSVVSCQLINKLHIQPITYNLQLLFPFLFGKEIKNHVLVNNWANGWVLDAVRSSEFMDSGQEDKVTTNQEPRTTNQSTIILFFLPQLLEWVGFTLLPLPFLLIFFKKNRNARSQ